MSVKLPNGALIYLATGYDAADTISAVTNASPAVVSSTGHGLSNLDPFELTSGWSRVNDRVFRAAGVATNALNIDGLDTTDTTVFPAGTGTGSLRKINAWTQMQQVTDLQTSGGDQQFTTYEFLENDFQTQLPTVVSPMTLTLTFADDVALPGQIAIASAAEARAKRALKMVMPGGGYIYMNGYVSFNPVPRMTKGQIMSVVGTFSLASLPVRYAS